MTAGADYSQESSYENTETTKTALVSSRYLFPQGRIDFAAPGSGFAGEIELSQGFTTSLCDSLATRVTAQTSAPDGKTRRP